MLAYLVRHAQSLANSDASEGLDSGLSPLGQEQAAALLRRFASVRIDAVYSSPYRRCIETALPIARRVGRSVLLRSELCEYHHLPPGTQVDLRLDEPAVLATCHDGVQLCPDCQCPVIWPTADEPFPAMIARSQAMAAFLRARWTGEEETVLCIGHGSPIARLVEAWLIDQPGPGFRFIIDNATVSAVRFCAGVSSLVCLNEASHLRGLPAPSAANFHPDGSIKPARPERAAG